MDSSKTIVILLKSPTSTCGYSSNSTSSSVTNCPFFPSSGPKTTCACWSSQESLKTMRYPSCPCRPLGIEAPALFTGEHFGIVPNCRGHHKLVCKFLRNVICYDRLEALSLNCRIPCSWKRSFVMRSKLWCVVMCLPN